MQLVYPHISTINDDHLQEIRNYEDYTQPYSVTYFK